jgi:AcrR family transcriptional regulator
MRQHCAIITRMPRKYEMKRRAERVEETRRRIVEAAIDLHRTIGPARASLSAIAERAGVERQTYYRHFPEERSLHLACSGLYLERHPLPDAEAWRAIDDPEQRLRRGLTEMYGYYEANAAMLSNVIRDAEVHPITRELVRERLAPGLQELRAALAEGLGSNDGTTQVGAAIGVALDFHTWRSLVRESGLSQEAAVELMSAMVRCAS